jgi:hypothetical protein
MAGKFGKMFSDYQTWQKLLKDCLYRDHQVMISGPDLNTDGPWNVGKTMMMETEMVP